MPYPLFDKSEWRAVTLQLQLDQGQRPWTEEEFDREWEEFIEKKRKKGIHLVRTTVGT